MKKLLLLSFFITSLFAKLEWGDIFDAFDEAKEQNKKVMIMLSQRGCSGCEYMKSVVLEDKNVQKVLKKEYIAVHIDIHEDSVPENLKYFATPTFYFLDKNETILKRLNGGQNAKDFLETLQKIKE